MLRRLKDAVDAIGDRLVAFLRELDRDAVPAEAVAAVTTELHTAAARFWAI